jgi:hypothetical protein
VSHARTVRTLAACGVLLAAGVSGCTDTSARPKPLPSPSPSSSVASPTPSPSATPPSLPAEARGTSAAAAKAFVRFYVDSINHALRTGDTTMTRKFSAPGCDSCAAVSRSIAQIYGTGDHLAGKGWQVTAVQAVAQQPVAHPILQVGLKIHPQSKVGADGTVKDRRAGGRKFMVMTLSRSGGNWLVDRLEQSA